MSGAQTATALAYEWIYQTLAGDAALTALVGTRIYSDQAPEGATYPLVVFAFYTGSDNVAMAHYWLTDAQYIVRVADRVGSIAGLDAIMARIHVLLHGQFDITRTHGYVNASVRVRPLAEPPTPVAGVATRTLAWLYRIQTQEVPA